MKMIAHKNTTVVNKKFVAIGFLLWLVSAVAYVLYTVPFYSEEERQRIRAVGGAVEKYEAILDAEWTDEHCTLDTALTPASRCPVCRRTGRCLPRTSAPTWSVMAPMCISSR